jgi:hypothetical protein
MAALETYAVVVRPSRTPVRLRRRFRLHLLAILADVTLALVVVTRRASDGGNVCCMADWFGDVCG